MLEVAYNYGVPHYARGNECGFLKIRNRVAYSNLEEAGLGHEVAFNVREARSPDGHLFQVLNEDPGDAGSLSSLCLAVTDLERSLGGCAPRRLNMRAGSRAARTLPRRACASHLLGVACLQPSGLTCWACWRLTRATALWCYPAVGGRALAGGQGGGTASSC